MKKLVTFTATWCGPCKMLKPILKELQGDGLINWINYDIDENKDLAIEKQIKSVPTLIFYDASGQETFVANGFMPKEKVLKLYGEPDVHPQTVDEFFDLEVEVEVVDSLGEDLEVDIVAEVEKDEVEVLTPPTAEDEEVIFTPPHTIFDEQPEDELVVEDEAAEDIEPLV